MDPFGIVALVVGAGWLFGKLNEDNKPKPPPDKSATWRESSPAAAPVAEHRPSPDRVSVPVKATRFKGGDEAIEVLPEYTLVRDLVRAGFPVTFVTGGAGTGKSTFVHWLTKEFDGNVLLAAPTGIAALNINGKTLHSLCKLPPAWIVKKDIRHFKPEIALQAKLLIIDEISMVNANLLDGVSAFFRMSRNSSEPFGGLPAVLVGDLFQLPPIVTNQTRHLFAAEYPTPKFFGAHLLQKAPYYAIELRKAFRQVDQVFVDLLAKLREGVEVAASIAELNRLCVTTSNPPATAVWLSPRNQEVDERNRVELSKLNGPSRLYIGTLTGKFKGDRLPSPQNLELRVGAQVMFTKNSARWVNGTIAVVVAMLDGRVEVRVHETGTVVDVSPMSWEQFDYKLNPDTRQVERAVVGEYLQIPLMLAWSLTIHKSQGKTIERVHIDLGAGAFETGQTYVALSRCRSLDTLTLSRPLSEADVLVDAESRKFYRKLRELMRTVPPEAMARKMGQPYGDRENAPNPDDGLRTEIIPTEVQSALRTKVVDLVGSDKLTAGSASAAETGDVSPAPGQSAWFACPSCQRRYPSRDWRPRFTCQDPACLMTWSPLEPLACE
ncbi:ATP-dependent DNA helicase [Variovorax rhizosphaerae]|uniref:AAA family ATPase n=1 Tax=Variovorax rhizosphaerae TaxID=1836200 RepID=A0ABU8WHD3_9BURK